METELRLNLQNQSDIVTVIGEFIPYGEKILKKIPTAEESMDLTLSHLQRSVFYSFIHRRP